MADVSSLRLAGHVVLITGAESGIGRETALRAVGEGADIAAIGLDRDGLDSLVEQVRARVGALAARIADVSDAAALTSAVGELADELGPLHVADANVGILIPASTITDLDLDEWNRVLAVNLTGVMLTFRGRAPHFGADGGVLLATGSSPRSGRARAPALRGREGRCARHRPEPGPRARAAWIRVNVIAPGLTDTPMTRGVVRSHRARAPAVPLGELVRQAMSRRSQCTS